jgi:hypothetical protein
MPYGTLPFDRASETHCGYAEDDSPQARTERDRQAKAAVVVAGRSTNAADCRDLLEQLGLLETARRLRRVAT